MESIKESLVPSLLVSDLPREGQIKITAEPELPSNVWYRITELCTTDTAQAAGEVRELSISWTDAFSILPQIAKLRSAFRFAIELDPTCTERFKQFQLERKAVEQARQSSEIRKLGDAEISDLLKKLGFTKRELKPFQKRDVARLLALPHGANFSVPGAGKTTAALAVHTLWRKPETALLVIAPKNAFAAWEETLADSIDLDAPEGIASPFVRLAGNEQALSEQLFSSSLKFLVSYERFTRYVRTFLLFCSQRQVHVILDESHRIKAGAYSQRGHAILSAAALPVRRDILSGTPLPHDISDLTSQLDFLWPGQNMSSLLIEGVGPGLALRNLYVRTTKAQLGLVPPKRRFVSVAMSPVQAALYGIIRDETLQQLAKIKHAKGDIVSARRSVIRLLQASVTPVSAAFKILGNDESPSVVNLLDALVSEGDSNKLLKACEIIRKTVEDGKKIVVWTIFTETILRLEKLLADLIPLTLYGATPTGDLEDDDSREGRIRLFHDSPINRVLIANPAACSEGISLHKICHEALYVDRSYNAAHYLQSVDRIHRIGLEPDVQTNIHILQSVAPQGIGSIDYSVSRRLLSKMETMNSVLDDEDIRAMALDEESADSVIDDDTTMDDLIDLLEQLSTAKAPAEDDQI